MKLHFIQMVDFEDSNMAQSVDSALIDTQLQLGVAIATGNGETVSTVSARSKCAGRFDTGGKTIKTVEAKTPDICTQLKLGGNEKISAWNSLLEQHAVTQKGISLI
jgi:hypothetical protein